MQRRLRPRTGHPDKGSLARGAQHHGTLAGVRGSEGDASRQRAGVQGPRLSLGCRRHGIETVPRPVKVPHVGGHIERLIGRLMGEVHLLSGTTFSDPRQRGEYDAEGRARITQSEFEWWLALQIVGIYHASEHRQLLRPPLAVWEEAIAALPLHRRREPPANDDPLLLDFLPFRTPAVGGQTIQLFNLVYHDPILKHWQVRREKPIVRYDKRDMSQVWVFDDAADRYWPISLRDPIPGRISFWEHQQARQALRAQGYLTVFG
ncbi:hypothetical protein Sp245p_19210 (plasmid) [Azospirillum baldaniorum]|nr:hypothetical protein Sp245p_19210 [Azospirillum baldaniorum]